jgi:hypothetical protein
MGHPLAAALMQRIAISVARHLHQKIQVSMVAYLDDWLVYSTGTLPADIIIQEIQQLGFTINFKKSSTVPVQCLVYLGLLIDTATGTVGPTQACLQHLTELSSLVPVASRQDLLQIMGYIACLPTPCAGPYS